MRFVVASGAMVGISSVAGSLLLAPPFIDTAAAGDNTDEIIILLLDEPDELIEVRWVRKWNSFIQGNANTVSLKGRDNGL
jgi:hypothetical protein